MKNVVKPLAKSVLIQLGLTTAASATAIGLLMFGSGTHPSDLPKWTTLIISIEEINNIIKIVKSLE